MPQKQFFPIRMLGVLVLAASVLSGVAGVSAHPSAAKLDPITLWTKFNDQNPQNTQDKWLAAALKDYTTTTGNAVTNVFQPYDQINSKLNIAVTAKGDVPDVSYLDSQYVPFFQKNGDLTDLTDFVKAAPWYKDLEKGSLNACTGTDGKIYCVPTSMATEAVYYWKDYFPKGFPATAQDLLTAATDFKTKNPSKFIVTFKGTENGSFSVTWFPLIVSAGGSIADPKTNLANWANPQTAAVVQWARDVFAGKHAPEIDLAPGFDDETPFTKAAAASFLAGSWSYVYLNPLIAPDGTKFDNDAASVQKAFEAGKLGFAPPLAWKGGTPVSLYGATGYAIPLGAKNIDGAKAFITYAMQTQQNADYAVAYGALPALTSSLADKNLTTGYWKAIADIQTQYGHVPPPLVDYDKGIAALVDTINKLIADPSQDIMKGLQDAQDNYNSSQK